MNTEYENTARSSYDHCVQAVRRAGLFHFTLSAAGLLVCLCAGCSTVKPAPSDSVGPIQLQKQPEQKKPAVARAPNTQPPAATQKPAAVQTKARPAEPQPPPRTVSREPEPVAPQPPSKPVAVELPPAAPLPQPQARPQVATRTPVRVDSPRMMTPRPPVRVPEPPTPQAVSRENSREAPASAAPGAVTDPNDRRDREAIGASHSQAAIPNPATASAGEGPSSPSSPRTNSANDLVSVNFEQVDVRMVLKSIGEITGINFIPHAGVAGPVTVMSPTPIHLSEVYGFLQSVLEVYGYATIETDNAVKVVPKAEAVKRNLEVHIGADPAYIPKTDMLITQILPLKHADAAEVSQILEPFLSAGTQSASCPRINSILITDTSSNIHYIAQIVQQLDVEGSEEKVVTFPLAHASAQVLSDQINRILEKSPSATAAPAGGTRPRITPTGGKNQKVLPDDRTNTLIAVAGDQEIETIRRLVAQLDVERPIGMDNVHVSYLKNADANEVARSLQAALAGTKMTGGTEGKQAVQVTPDGSTNSVIVVASPQDFEVVSQIIAKLDILREQVLVEMLILEVTEEGLKQIGVDWATLDRAVSDGVRGFASTNLGPRADYQSGTLEGLAVGAWKGTGSNTRIGAILQMLQTTTGVNILSMPHIVTSNHRKAKIIVGESRPFVTASRITETTDPAAPTVIKQYDYKDVGVTMEITPHISQGGLIRLDIDSEITKLLQATTSASVDTPTTAKRHAETTVTMNSDATVVIGGLAGDDTTRVEKKIPLLGDLPLLGALFRSREEQTQKTNLLIFITPHVMTGQDDWIDVSNKKKEQMPPAYEWDR